MRKVIRHLTRSKYEKETQMPDYHGKWLKAPKHLLFETNKGVAIITLNKPEKRNALSHQMLEELRDALLEADDRTDINCIIVQGAGKDFCSGYDLEAAYEVVDDQKLPYSYRKSSNGFDDDAWSLERTQPLILSVFNTHKPVIAKIHGNCLAGGTDLALACDIIVVAEDAKIGFPATRANGSPPNNMWIYHVGPQWAKRLLFTGDKITGADAVKIGLALDCVPADELDAEVMHLAHRIAAVDNELLSSQKRVVNLALEQMGALTMQRIAAETDARAHLSTGPRRTRFKKDMAEHGLKEALKNRDAPFDHGFARVRGK